MHQNKSFRLSVMSVKAAMQLYSITYRFTLNMPFPYLEVAARPKTSASHANNTIQFLSKSLSVNSFVRDYATHRKSL